MGAIFDCRKGTILHAAQEGGPWKERHVPRKFGTVVLEYTTFATNVDTGKLKVNLADMQENCPGQMVMEKVPQDP